MATKRYPHSIRFSKDEWRNVAAAAERNGMAPGEYIRDAAARSATKELGLNEGQLTPQMIEMIKRTFRGVHLLAYLKREEFVELGREDDLKAAAEAARIAQSDMLGSDESDRDS